MFFTMFVYKFVSAIPTGNYLIIVLFSYISLPIGFIFYIRYNVK